MSIEAMKQALEALELVPYMSNKDDHDYYAKAINALRTAIQQAESEPHPPYRDCGCDDCKPSFTDSEPLTDTFVQTVPDKCDRILWRDRYLHLPINHPAPGVPDDVVRDAQRYRWLRDFDHWPAPFASSQEPEPVRGAYLDAAIDALAKAEGREA